MDDDIDMDYLNEVLDRIIGGNKRANNIMLEVTNVLWANLLKCVRENKTTNFDYSFETYALLDSQTANVLDEHWNTQFSIFVRGMQYSMTIDSSMKIITVSWKWNPDYTPPKRMHCAFFEIVNEMMRICKERYNGDIHEKVGEI